MKKLLISLIFFTVFSNIYALGIGAQAEVIPVQSDESTTIFPGIAGTAKFDAQPFYYTFSTDYSPLKSTALISIASDWHFTELEFVPNFGFFLGTGLAIGTSFSKSTFDFTVGSRALLGINWIFFDGFFELFVQQAVQPSFQIPIATSDSSFRFCMQYPLSIGIRIWD